MISTIYYKGKNYPEYQAEGFSAQFILPFAMKVCRGRGVDVGCNRLEWSLPHAFPVDPVIDSNYDALNFPDEYHNLDFVFSSHCLEHLHNWVDVLDYWISRLKTGGVLFLYLPHYDQEYWRPWNNRKHLNIFTPEIIVDYLKSKEMKKIFASGRDLNHSFAVMCEK